MNSVFLSEKNNFLILYLGRLNVDKGVYDLIKAADYILKNHNNINFGLRYDAKCRFSVFGVKVGGIRTHNSEESDLQSDVETISTSTLKRVVFSAYDLYFPECARVSSEGLSLLLKNAAGFSQEDVQVSKFTPVGARL